MVTPLRARYGTHVADCALEVRLGFVRKVFAIVAAQLLCTVTICAAVFVSPSLRTFLQLRYVCMMRVSMFSLCRFAHSVCNLLGGVFKRWVDDHVITDKTHGRETPMVF